MRRVVDWMRSKLCVNAHTRTRFNHPLTSIRLPVQQRVALVVADVEVKRRDVVRQLGGWGRVVRHFFGWLDGWKTQ